VTSNHLPAPTTTHQVVVTPEPRRLRSETTALLAEWGSENTQRAYGSDLRHVHQWLVEQGMATADEDVLVAVLRCTSDPAVVADYLAAFADTLRPSTLNRRVAAIGKLHKLNVALTGKGTAPTSDPVVRLALASARRRYADQVAASRAAGADVLPVKRAAALMSEAVTAMLNADVPDPRGARDRALLALGWWGTLRRSELVALDVADVREVAQGLVLTIRRSKTDQTGMGREVPVDRNPTDPERCPVVALRRWLAVSGLTSGALFRRVSRGGRVLEQRLGAQAVGRILKERAVAAGLDQGTVDKLTAHSLRAGGITARALAGHSVFEIQAVSGHKSLAILNDYVRVADPFRGTRPLVI
jgi:site-specific recombinase XerD